MVAGTSKKDPLECHQNAILVIGKSDACSAYIGSIRSIAGTIKRITKGNTNMM